MSPWDEMGYFDLPKRTSTTINATSAGQIIGPNPMRVGLIISTPSVAGTVSVSPTPDLTGTVTGIFVSSGTSPLMITQAQWGIMCQVAWMGQNTGTQAATFTAVELILHEWPKEGDQYGLAMLRKLADAIGLTKPGS